MQLDFYLVRGILATGGQTLQYVTYAAAKNENAQARCVLFVSDNQVFRGLTEISPEIGGPVIASYELLEFTTPYETDERLGTSRLKLVNATDMDLLKNTEPVYTL